MTFGNVMIKAREQYPVKNREYMCHSYPTLAR